MELSLRGPESEPIPKPRQEDGSDPAIRLFGGVSKIATYDRTYET